MHRGAAPAPRGAVGGPQPAAGANTMSVTVQENSAPSVIDLAPVFAAMGVDCTEGLQLSMLGNTNAALVTPDLSETELTLTYAPGQFGAATLTVGATDADGVSARETIFVTVIAPTPAPAGGPAPMPGGVPVSTTAST
jgi:hypothetical protein